MKRTGLVLGIVAVLGLGTAYGSKPFESHFNIDMGAIESEVEDVALPSGVLKENIIYCRYPVQGDWVGVWQHSGFVTLNPNAALFAYARGTFTGQILAPDGMWYEGTVEYVTFTKAKVMPDGSVVDLWSQWTILSGTGDLANLRGHGVEDAEGHDTGWLHFDP